MGNQLPHGTHRTLCWIHGIHIYNTGRKRVALGFEVQGFWVLARICTLTLAKLLFPSSKGRQGSSIYAQQREISESCKAVPPLPHGAV